VETMSWLSDRFHELVAWLTYTLDPASRKPTKQTKVAQELTYLDPPDAARTGPGRPR